MAPPKSAFTFFQNFKGTSNGDPRLSLSLSLSLDSRDDLGAATSGQRVWGILDSVLIEICARLALRALAPFRLDLQRTRLDHSTGVRGPGDCRDARGLRRVRQGEVLVRALQRERGLRELSLGPLQQPHGAGSVRLARKRSVWSLAYSPSRPKATARVQSERASDSLSLSLSKRDAF